eukprot:gb/GEZN01007002.1/.p1 GENE.gb/GEZN01007002.1/~~gb/GEZN01007002.1/.p1  ORF type:complete len:372 (-),score=94.13 gb/GEZN01007002.1/:455-1570(-)
MSKAEKEGQGGKAIKLDLDGLAELGEKEDPEGSEVVVPSFKKAKKRKRGVRAAKTDEEFKAEGEQMEKSRDALEQAKWVQKHRKRHAGINPEEADKASCREDAMEELEEEEEGAPQGLATTAAEKGIQEGFKKEVNQQSILDAQKEKFIQEKMDEMKKGRSGVDTGKSLLPEQKQEESRISELRKKEQDLYKDKALECLDGHKNPFMDGEEESGDRWLAGIAEVSLPIAFKIKNIEQTELAKQKLFQAPLVKSGSGPSSAPTNMSKDFRTHRREYAEAKQEERVQARIARAVKEGEEPPEDQLKRLETLKHRKEKREGRKDQILDAPVLGAQAPPPGPIGPASSGRRGPAGKKATDDAIMDRFIRRYKWTR